MAPTLSSQPFSQAMISEHNWERPMSSEAGTHHISGFCPFCPFAPAAHPLITSSLGTQCNNRTKEPGLFPFVFLSFEARQLRQAITPTARPSHVRLTPPGAAKLLARGYCTSAPGAHQHQVPMVQRCGRLPRQGRAGWHIPHKAALCSSALALTEHLGSQLSCFHLQTSHHLKRDH